MPSLLAMVSAIWQPIIYIYFFLIYIFLQYFIVSDTHFIDELFTKFGLLFVSTLDWSVGVLVSVWQEMRIAEQ